MMSEAEKNKEIDARGFAWQVTPSKDGVRTRGKMRVDPRLRAWHTCLHCGTKPLMAWPPEFRQGWPEIRFLLSVADRSTRCLWSKPCQGKLPGHVPSH